MEKENHCTQCIRCSERAEEVPTTPRVTAQAGSAFAWLVRAVGRCLTGFPTPPRMSVNGRVEVGTHEREQWVSTAGRAGANARKRQSCSAEAQAQCRRSIARTPRAGRGNATHPCSRPLWPLWLAGLGARAPALSTRPTCFGSLFAALGRRVIRGGDACGESAQARYAVDAPSPWSRAPGLASAASRLAGQSLCVLFGAWRTADGSDRAGYRGTGWCICRPTADGASAHVAPCARLLPRIARPGHTRHTGIPRPSLDHAHRPLHRVEPGSVQGVLPRLILAAPLPHGAAFSLSCHTNGAGRLCAAPAASYRVPRGAP